MSDALRDQEDLILARQQFDRQPRACQAVTRKGTPCPIPAEGGMFCHVHDPSRTFQQQQRAKRKR